MKSTLLSSAVLAGALAISFAAQAQQPPAAPAAPASAPIPQYAAPGVNLEQAKQAIAAAAAEARKNNWPVAIAVMSNGGHLVAFERLDGTQFASIRIAQDKARAAAMYRRPTKVFEDRVAAGGGGLSVLTLEGVVASEGGIPLMREGKIIGAIGVSGVLSSQDGQVAKAGADAIK